MLNERLYAQALLYHCDISGTVRDKAQEWKLLVMRFNGVNLYATCHFFAWQCLKFHICNLLHDCIWAYLAPFLLVVLWPDLWLRTALSLPVSFMKSSHDKECDRKTAFELLPFVCMGLCTCMYKLYMCTWLWRLVWKSKEEVENYCAWLKFSGLGSALAP